MYPTNKLNAAGTFVKEEYEVLKTHVLMDLLIIHPGKSRLAYIKHFFLLAYKAFFTKYNIVHIQHSHLIIYGLLLKFFNSSVVIIATNHEGEIFKPSKNSYEKLKIVILKNFANRIANEVIYTNPDMVSFYRKDSKYYSIIPVGINTNKFRELDRLKARIQLKLSTDDIIIFIPNHTRNHNKGEVTLALLKKHFSESQFDGKRVINFIQAQNIPHQDMPLYYAMADMVMLLSPYESSPTTIKEAMAMNKPILSTDVGDVKRLFESVKGVDTFKISDSIESIGRKVDNILGYTQSEGRARILAKELSLSQSAGKILDLYKKYTNA